MQSDFSNLILSTAPDRPLLQAGHLEKKLARGWLFQGLSFILNAGDCLALVGASGSGKSLLLRMLAGLDPLPAGEIRFLEKSLVDWPMPVYRTQVMYLSQKAAFQEGPLEASLQYPFRFQVHQQRVYQPTEALSLATALGRDAAFLQLATDTLSGGESQLAALMRALLLEPRILLLDEATSALDPVSAGLAEVLLKQWLQGPGRACIWASHDQTLHQRMATATLRLASEA